MYAKFIGGLSGFLYTYLLPILLLGGGIYFSIKLGFIQLKMIGESLNVISEKPDENAHVSSFQALMISTASRVGTGNIVGVSTAIVGGGPGAVFWMWIVAFLGAASAFVESTLAQIYKKRSATGESYGGPAYYIEGGLKNRKLGILFAVILILTYMIGFNMLAGFNVASAFTTYDNVNPQTVAYIIGAVLAVLTAISIFGGGKRLSEITSVLVPIMSALYILVAIIVIIKNIQLIPGIFASIFKEALNFRAIFGGFAGSAVMHGLKRGLYSNEAGIGSAPNAAASADTSHPVKQGLVQMLSVYLDTWIICTATALMLLASGVTATPEMAGAPYNVEALVHNFGPMGQHLFAAGLFLFGFTTLIGNYFYSEANLRYILRDNFSMTKLNIFRIIAVVIIFLGPSLEFGVAWDTADVLMAFMAIINIPTLFLLKEPVFVALADYKRQLKENKNPIFKLKDAGLPIDVDYWK